MDGTVSGGEDFFTSWHLVCKRSIRCPSVCLCLSVTFMHCVRTAKSITKRFHFMTVFPFYSILTLNVKSKIRRNRPTGELNICDIMKNSQFRTIISLYFANDTDETSYYGTLI